jgi:hypothetical protein
VFSVSPFLRFPLVSRIGRCGDLLLCANYLFVEAILAGSGGLPA